MSAPVKKCEVTPLEALLRLIAIASMIDTNECKDELIYNTLQGEIAVAKEVVKALAAATVAPVEAQPVVPAPIDWKDRLYVAMNAEFALRGGPKRDEDGQRMGMVIDDTQVGVEFAMSFFEQNMLAAPSLEAQPAGEVERDAARYRWLLANYATGDGYHKIDAALNDGEADKYLNAAIDAAMAQGEKHDK